jgi:chemotaxis protein MotB
VASRKTGIAPPPPIEDNDSEINTVYGDMITFVAMLFILLFTLSYNEKKDETFFTQMRLQFGAKDVTQEHVITTEELFVSKVQGFIEKKDLQEYARVLVDEQKIKLVLQSPILFKSGSAELSDRAIDIFDGLAAVFKQVENPMIIEGHTDNVPIHTDKYDSNWELSFDRSYSVLKLFIHKHGFSPRQLSCLGYGEYRPLIANDTEENRAQNRRIEINVIRITAAESENIGI